MSKRLIDIHNHSLYGVDDGAKTREESIKMLKAAAAQGIEAIILTPHYRHGMFAYPLDTIDEQYRMLQSEAEGIGLRLYLGCEYHVNSDIAAAFLSGRCHTLADGDYVLTEYSYRTEYSDMTRYTQQLLSRGYLPVLAHVERYACIQKKPELCAALADMGAVIQVNADSVLGLDGRGMARVCRRLLKKGLVDVIASDAHGIKERPNHMGECRAYVAKKYGEDYAEQLFFRNPVRITEAAHR